MVVSFRRRCIGGLGLREGRGDRHIEQQLVFFFLVLLLNIVKGRRDCAKAGFGVGMRKVLHWQNIKVM
jgi:hypothetical protein